MKGFCTGGLVALFLFLAVENGMGQSSQVWSEYMFNVPSGKRTNFEFAATYSTVVGQPKWRSFDLQVTPEIALNRHFDIMGAILFSSTFQSEALSTWEIREMLGTRIHFTPGSRVQTRLLLRLEQRNMKDLETGEWEQSNRARARAELLYPINATSMSHNKLWYGISDVESFMVLDKDVHERYANRLRFRVGAGYRFNDKFRVEFIYMLQQSKNTVGGGFESTDNIFRFRLKHYLVSKKS